MGHFFLRNGEQKRRNRSSNDCRLGIAQLKGFCEAKKVGNSMAANPGLAMVIEKWGIMFVFDVRLWMPLWLGAEFSATIILHKLDTDNH